MTKCFGLIWKTFNDLGQPNDSQISATFEFLAN